MFVLYFDAKTNKVHGMNGSGRSPKALDLAKARELGITGKEIPLLNLNSSVAPLLLFRGEPLADTQVKLVSLSLDVPLDGSTRTHCTVRASSPLPKSWLLPSLSPRMGTRLVHLLLI